MVSNEFVSDCLSGDEEAIQLLVRTHQRAVFQLTLSVLDRSDAPVTETVGQAEIATRETFVAALDRLGRYREETPFHVWLSRIAIQVSLKRYRAWQREQRIKRLWARLRGTGQPATAGPTPAPAVEAGPPRSRTDEALWQTARALDDRLRLPVVLRYYHELPVKEIAAILRLSEGAVHARLDRAREKLALAGETDPNRPDLRKVD
jgi:RNA polymerase sigma-70 factor (ECF subfamily)